MSHKQRSARSSSSCQQRGLLLQPAAVLPGSGIPRGHTNVLQRAGQAAALCMPPDMRPGSPWRRHQARCVAAGRTCACPRALHDQLPRAPLEVGRKARHAQRIHARGQPRVGRPQHLRGGWVVVVVCVGVGGRWGGVGWAWGCAAQTQRAGRACRGDGATRGTQRQQGCGRAARGRRLPSRAAPGQACYACTAAAAGAGEARQQGAPPLPPGRTCRPVPQAAPSALTPPPSPRQRATLGSRATRLQRGEGAGGCR